MGRKPAKMGRKPANMGRTPRGTQKKRKRCKARNPSLFQIIYEARSGELSKLLKAEMADHLRTLSNQLSIRKREIEGGQKRTLFRLGADPIIDKAGVEVRKAALKKITKRALSQAIREYLLDGHFSTAAIGGLSPQELEIIRKHFEKFSPEKLEIMRKRLREPPKKRKR